MPKYPTDSWRAREALMDREVYATGGAMKATAGWESLPWNTQLPADWKARYWEDSDDITYVVWSYATPIAWVKRDGDVVIPDVKYSVTTSKHQGMLYALRLGGEPAGSTDRDVRAGIRAAAQRERDRAREARHVREDRAREAAQSARVAGTYERPHHPAESPNPLYRTPLDDWHTEQEVTRTVRQRGEPLPTSWEDGWNAPRPFATNDGAIYSDDYLFRRNKP